MLIYIHKGMLSAPFCEKSIWPDIGFGVRNIRQLWGSHDLLLPLPLLLCPRVLAFSHRQFHYLWNENHKWQLAYSHGVALRILQGNCWGSTLATVTCSVALPGFDMGSFTNSFEKKVRLLSGQEMDYFFERMCVFGCCLPITGCMFYQDPHRFYFAAQLVSSKTTLVPSMSAYGCSSVVSLAPSPKLSSVTDPFLMPDDLNAGWKVRRMFSHSRSICL